MFCHFWLDCTWNVLFKSKDVSECWVLRRQFNWIVLHEYFFCMSGVLFYCNKFSRTHLPIVLLFLLWPNHLVHDFIIPNLVVCAHCTLQYSCQRCLNQIAPILLRPCNAEDIWGQRILRKGQQMLAPCGHIKVKSIWGCTSEILLNIL